ncbi:CotH kinase family protein, partial [candidate division KSB1 bacterium]|nr:CotH kinase family protein [candidate division KSB1 bacterium]
ANSAIESDGPATFNISSYIKDLSAGENLFAVQGLNAGTNSSDFLITCEVVADPERTGDFVSSNLPLLFIDTQGQTIPDDPRIDAIMGIVDNGPGELNDVTDPWNHYNGHIGIELRGSTSRGFPKKPYRIETLDALGNNLNVSLLGMPAENDWVLHNPWSDKTQMRNVLAYKISRDIGRYASRTRFCELFLNGEYQGIYVLMEKLKRDKNRVDIERLDIDDTAGDSLTGGYIIKIDKMDGEQVGGWMDGNIFYQYHYPQPNDITEEQKNYIEDFMTKFGTAVRQGERDGSDAAYADYIDLESFVNHFLINEISRNIDAYRLSAFMYKDRDSNDSRLTMGPVWDFNLSFGNGDYYNGWETEGWNLDHLIAACGGDFAPPFWWKTIRNSHRFLSTLKRRWAVLRPDILSTDRLLNYIDAVADTLDEAQKRNFEKWPTLGTYLWPNWFVGETYEEEIYFMKQWLAGRLEWMDKAIGEISEVADTPPGDSGFHLNQNYPNPFNSETRILYRLSNAGNVRIRIYAVNGSPVRTLIRDTYLADGNYTAVWNGRDENGKNAPSGVYFCRFEFFHNKSFYSQTRKMVLVR